MGATKLPIAKKPIFVKIAPGVALGYRRNASAGTSVVRCADGRGGNWTKAIGIADDFEDATTGRTLTFWTAQQRARELARGGLGGGDVSKLITVAEALAAYEVDLRARGGDVYNARRCRIHLPSILASKTVALLTAKELRHWRGGLLEAGLAPPQSRGRAGRSRRRSTSRPATIPASPIAAHGASGSRPCGCRKRP